MPCCASNRYSGMPTRWRMSEGNTGCTAIARCARIPRGQGPRACTQAPCLGTGRSHVCLQRRDCRPYREVKGRTPMTNGRGKSDRFIVGAEQRVAQEGSSPSGAQMRSAISKSGDKTSLAGESEGMQTSKRARRRKLDTAKTDLKPPLAVLRRAGCPSSRRSQDGIRRA